MGPKFKNPLVGKEKYNQFIVFGGERVCPFSVLWFRLSDCPAIILKPLTLHNKGIGQTVERVCRLKVKSFCGGRSSYLALKK